MISAQDFKKIGYFPHYRFENLDEIDFSKLTHVNISFANPDINGNLSVGDGKDISDVVDRAHAFNVEVYIALAGGFLYPDWEIAWKHLMKPGNRSDFIHHIVSYAQSHNLQGIDIDLEWSHVDEMYSGFVLELADSLVDHNLGLTAALPGNYRYPEISNEALAVFDWINIMAYDLRGSWNPLDIGPHSPYSFAVNSFNYWLNQGVGNDRLTLGVPFYGYDFTDQDDVHSLTFNQIVALNPNNAHKDKAGLIFYNGIPTIINKTIYALENCSGIMIWEIGQDNYGYYSLLDVIDSTVNSIISDVEKDLKTGMTIFPNPFESKLNISSQNMELGSTIKIFDLTGNLVLNKEVRDSSTITIFTDHLPKGLYFFSLITSKGIVIKEIVKH